MNLLQVPSTLLSFFQLHQSPQMQSTVKNRLSFYDQLDLYYHQNGLYTPQLAADVYLASWDESMRPLRDCAHRAVEFYVSKLEPGTSLPIVTENDAITEPIHKIWKWSNFFSKKSLIARQFALYGDVFIKATATPTSVYQRYFQPRYVTSFDEDDQGNINNIRLDIPTGEKTYTEIWSMNGYATYLHKFGLGEDIRYLGSPASQGTLASLGIDFIPFSHAKFIDVGEDWGVGCFVHAMDKIDEANRMATRLHQMLFRYNKALWVAQANGNDAQGRPLPPPKVGAANNTITVEDDTILSMPGTSTLNSLVPDIKYADALAVLQDQMHEIERDLPELAYFDLKSVGAISGKAVIALLGDAVDKAQEARANFEAALIKSDQHALTLGQVNNLFSGLGTYDAGDFSHSIKERPIFPPTEEEKAATVKVYTDATMPLGVAMKLAGFAEDIIAEALAEVDSSNTKAMASIGAGFNAGQLP